MVLLRGRLLGHGRCSSSLSAQERTTAGEMFGGTELQILISAGDLCACALVFPLPM